MYKPSALHVMAVAMLAVAGTASAGEVSVLATEFRASPPGGWQVSTTLEHADTGWEHYADAWRVVSADGSVLGTRVLYHPHVDEQPFTRSLAVTTPADVRVVFVEARDLVHGWSSRRLRVNLDDVVDGRLRVAR
jgi:hypothetical protein